ncbi:MAG: transcriptional repressor [Candidatus Aminicenantes bacterium]|nr:transcriptional repressor [Candidatus Aminicenantes bacterium]
MITKMENACKHLKTRGIKPSYQRIKIFEYLLRNRNHPTVDMIYRKLVPRIPTLSKTTVYNTLNLFIEKEIASIIIIEENETRYDADTSVHGHFKCRKCTKVYDLDIDLSKIDIPMLAEHSVTEHHFYFKGICKNCR